MAFRNTEGRGGSESDDESYRKGETQRQCSCGTFYKKADYGKHLKDGTHNKVIDGRRSTPA